MATFLLEKHDIQIKPKTLYNQALKSTLQLNNDAEACLECISSSESKSEENEETYFTITLSDKEWEAIKPVNVDYKREKYNIKEYTVLPLQKWSSIIYSHLWNHTKLPCSLTFKRARVYSFGETFI